MENKKTRIAPVLLIGVFLLMFLVSCTKREFLPDADELKEKKTLEVWIFFDYNTPGTHYIDTWDALEEEFGVALDVKTFATEELKNKLSIALMCDELPDIFAVWGGSFPEYLFDAGACLPLQDYIEASGISYAPGYQKSYKDGNTYLIPCLVEAYAVTYCNRELMEKMNLETPSTWEELIDFVDEVNAYNKKNHTSYAAINLGNKDSWLGELLYTMIVNRINPYALDELMQGKITFEDDVFKEAAKKIKELNEHNAFPKEYMNTGEVESSEKFVNNEAVLMPHQSTILYYLMDNMGEDAIDLLQFPDCSGGTYPDCEAYLMNANHDMAPGLCINKKTAYPDEAAKICLEFSKRVNEINVSKYGYLNYRDDIVIEFPEDMPAQVAKFRDMVENKKHLTSFWFSVLDKDAVGPWQNMTKKLYAGVLDADAFTEEVKKILKFS